MLPSAGNNGFAAPRHRHGRPGLCPTRTWRPRTWRA